MHFVVSVNEIDIIIQPRLYCFDYQICADSTIVNNAIHSLPLVVGYVVEKKYAVFNYHKGLIKLKYRLFYASIFPCIFATSQKN